mmetsp:Transcript_21039/g.46284  ORF Transcript_21039/g.46284 Transcript_21039/m.46284 type:complete len:98 (-) Transcript_21039:103-396(-)
MKKSWEIENWLPGQNRRNQQGQRLQSQSEGRSAFFQAPGRLTLENNDVAGLSPDPCTPNPRRLHRQGPTMVPKVFEVPVSDGATGLQDLDVLHAVLL